MTLVEGTLRISIESLVNFLSYHIDLLWFFRLWLGNFLMLLIFLCLILSRGGFLYHGYIIMTRCKNIYNLLIIQIVKNWLFVIKVLRFICRLDLFFLVLQSSLFQIIFWVNHTRAELSPVNLFAPLIALIFQEKLINVRFWVLWTVIGVARKISMTLWSPWALWPLLVTMHIKYFWVLLNWLIIF